MACVLRFSGTGRMRAHPAPVSYTHLDVYKRQSMREKESAPGTSASVRPLSHCMCSWPASSTHSTVPFVPDGTGDQGSSILCSSTRHPAGYCFLMKSTISLQGVPSFLSFISTFLFFLFHIFFLFRTRLRQPLPEMCIRDRSLRVYKDY